MSDDTKMTLLPKEVVIETPSHLAPEQELIHIINNKPHIYFEDQWHEVWPYRYKN
jgi:hypothetical protein